MGVAIHSMAHSPKLADFVAKCEQFENDEFNGRDWVQSSCDMTSTPGYDNDGSTGPELVDNGVKLAFAARDYDSKVVIFYAYGYDTCYYVFGKDEDDAIRRLRSQLSDHFLLAAGLWITHELLDND